MKQVLILTLMLCSVALSAQKVLKIYDGSRVMVEYRVGDELHFKLKGDDVFYAFEIRDLDHASQTLRLELGIIKIADIVAVKSYENYGVANGLEKTLYTFGAGWVLFSGVDAIVSPDEARSTLRTAAIVAASSFLGGFLIKKTWATRIYRLDTDEYFMQVIDLTVDASDAKAPE